MQIAQCRQFAGGRPRRSFHMRRYAQIPSRGVSRLPGAHTRMHRRQRSIESGNSHGFAPIVPDL
jgi:hypothetical protein